MGMNSGRAPRGGQTGINGEFYRGGTFLPTTTQPKRGASERTSSNREEIAPYQWAAPPEPGLRSIYTVIRGAVIWSDPPTVREQRGLTDEERAQTGDLLSRYLNGERWFRPGLPAQPWRSPAEGEAAHDVRSPDGQFSAFVTSSPDVAAFEIARLTLEARTVRCVRCVQHPHGTDYTFTARGQQLRVEVRAQD